MTVNNIMNITAKKGEIFINDFIVKKGSIEIDYGSLVMETTSDLNLYWKTEEQKFCFSGPVINSITVTNCSVSGFLKKFPKKKKRKKRINFNIHFH